MSTWYYAIDGQRYGPVSFEQLQTQAADGHVKAADTVWTEGWANWKPAIDVPELRLAPAPLTTVAYHTPAGQMPERARRFLAGYAPPTGDVGDWPLDDTRVAQFVEAGRQRRRVRRAYGLYRGLCVLTAFGAVVIAITLLVPDSLSGTTPFSIAVFAGLMAVLAVLYGMAAWATQRNFAWGGYVIVGLLILSSGVSVVGIANSALSQSAESLAIALVHGVSLIFNVFFFTTAFGGLRGAKAFRASPAWCQEAIVRGEVTRRPKDPQG